MVRFIMLVALMLGCQAGTQASVAEKTKERGKQEATKPAIEKTEKPAPTPADIVEPKAEERTLVMILMKTSKGDIKIELDKEKAPETVENFLGYVASGHYKGTIFHRVIDGFMVQGGGFDADMNQKPASKTVKNEAANGLKNVVGSIAMARTSNPHSASAQFFINLKDNTFLDYPGQDGWGYCVFGRVVEGMDVVDDIKGVPTSNAGPHQNVPKDAIVINDVVVVEE